MIDYYLDENGDEVFCVNTEEPAGPCPNPGCCEVTVTPPDDPIDPCAQFSELCNPGATDPCEIDPNSCGGPGPDPGPGPGPTGACASRDKENLVERFNVDRTTAQHGADSDAVEVAQQACSGDWYYILPLVPLSYCGDGDSEGFTLVCSSCVIAHLLNHDEWHCSAKAKVTCNYTFHAR